MQDPPAPRPRLGGRLESQPTSRTVSVANTRCDCQPARNASYTPPQAPQSGRSLSERNRKPPCPLEATSGAGDASSTVRS